MKIKKRFAVMVAALVALALGGLAFAYWTQGGTGSGTANAGSTSAITVHQTGSPTGLYPGGPSAALSGTFDNPNANAVHISSVTASIHTLNVQTDLTKPACTAADFAIGGTSGANVVPAGTGVGTWTGLTVSMVDNGLNQDNCKNATVIIDYTANP